jgi:uncharacterized heparinase superfamily protein
VRPAQVAGQLRHRLRGVRPVAFVGPPPELAARPGRTLFLPAPRAGAWDGALRFRLLCREVAFAGRIDWAFAGEGPLWSFLLHQFHWARDPAIPARARCAAILDWIERCRGGTGWLADPTSFRILNWSKFLLAPSALPDDAGARARIAGSLAAQCETLARHLETHLLANHYFTNLSALTLAGLAFGGPAGDRWLAHAAAFQGQLAEQVGADGLHQERSPMYHAALLEQVLDLLHAADLSGRAPAALGEALRDAAARMLGALRVLTHPDGEIALFGDSAFGFAHPPAALEAHARALGVTPRAPDPPGLLADAGYVRLEGGPFVLLASVGGPAPAHQPGHAHADALAFELSVGGERVVTDTGVCEYRPGPRRDESRATRSHATLELDGRDQSELWAAHRVGGRARVHLVSAAPPHRAEATCRSWFAHDSLHRRSFEVHVDGVEITDHVEGGPRAVRATLPLAPGLEPALAGATARLRTPRGTELALALPRELAWSVERLGYMPELGRREERAALVGRGRPRSPMALRIGIA